jgi:hypothetical protein
MRYVSPSLTSALACEEITYADKGNACPDGGSEYLSTGAYEVDE